MVTLEASCSEDDSGEWGLFLHWTQFYLELPLVSRLGFASVVLSNKKSFRSWSAFAFHFVQNGHCIFSNQIYSNPSTHFSHITWSSAVIFRRGWTCDMQSPAVQSCSAIRCIITHFQTLYSWFGLWTMGAGEIK